MTKLQELYEFLFYLKTRKKELPYEQWKLNKETFENMINILDNYIQTRKKFLYEQNLVDSDLKIKKEIESLLSTHQSLIDLESQNRELKSVIDDIREGIMDESIEFGLDDVLEVIRGLEDD